MNSCNTWNRAYASAAETLEHLDLLAETKSLSDHATYQKLHTENELLCGRIFRFVQAVNQQHGEPTYLREDGGIYEP